MPWYWLLDPEARTLSVLRLVSEGYVVDRVVGVGLHALPPFDAVQIDLDSVFPPRSAQ